MNENNPQFLRLASTLAWGRMRQQERDNGLPALSLCLSFGPIPHDPTTHTNNPPSHVKALIYNLFDGLWKIKIKNALDFMEKNTQGGWAYYVIPPSPSANHKESDLRREKIFELMFSVENSKKFFSEN